MHDDTYMMSIVNNKKFDLKALEAFLAAMSCGSMTKAAAYLGVGQPAVTRMIKELEVAVGFQLFHRNGPRISPTDRGLRFHEEVQRVVAGLRQIGQRAEAIRTEKVASIDIAATPTMAAGLSGPALMMLAEDLPHQVNVQTMNAEYVIRALRSRTADFGIAANPIDHAGMVRHVVCESRLVGVVAENWPLASSPDPLSLSVFAERRLITVGNAFRIRHAIDQAFQKLDISPPSEFATNTSLNAVMAARSGLGVAIVDPVTAYGVPVAGVKIVPLETRIPYVWELLSDADRALSRHLSAFVDAFRRACVATVPDCVVTSAGGDAVLADIHQSS
ncbi:LysR family transcriptional regulator [Labrenzia sp. OB1]|uniref:LysR family transcriptional regulator n=1 Tax=Labrenzia sp. OB1 TaxID=1561204 RepID=UPI00244B97CE|nr:LysR family transcriptional regulator [Labrenzia sp. OB1]